MDLNNQIIIYQTEDGLTQVDVRMENDMIWLTRQQIAVLFGRDYKTISKHINNALKEELADSVVVAKIANTTLHGAIEGKTQTHEIDYFNLEVITSVGYRVKSKRGVQFRQWANNVLKQYLIKGYAVNERMRKEQIGELRQLVGMLGRTFKSSIGQIYQTFGGEELYPSVEEKAAMLLYLVTKNHSFSDGNKRIAATLFLWFLNNNHILYHPDGTKRIADSTLVALTLMIAESRTEEKDVMVKVVVNLINKNSDE